MDSKKSKKMKWEKKKIYKFFFTLKDVQKKEKKQKDKQTETEKRKEKIIE